MNRHCARPICSSSAAATLRYDYAGQTVWLEPLHAEAHPMTHDLCIRHADRLLVPQGWLLQDSRVA